MTDCGDVGCSYAESSGRSTTSKQRTTVVIGGKLTAWESLEDAFAGDFVALRCSGPTPEILSYCQRLIPCVLLVEPSFLDGVDPVDFGNLVDFGRSIQVLVIGEEKEDPETVEALVRLGCMGFLPASADPAQIRQAVSTVAAGELWFSRRTVSRLLLALLRADRCKLTARESEILRLIGQGLKNQEIADHLYISPQTVRWHIRSLYSKIGVRDRLSAALYAAGQAREELRMSATVGRSGEGPP